VFLGMKHASSSPLQPHFTGIYQLLVLFPF
jgi:hypothetical protein